MSSTKLPYIDMITHAIFEIADRKGASRDMIWKYLQVKFPEGVRDKKVFVARLYKLSKEDNHIQGVKGNIHRFRLSQQYRGKLIKAMAKGEKIKPKKTNAMTKKTKNPKKKVSKMTKAKLSKTVKGKETLKKMSKKEDKAKKLSKSKMASANKKVDTMKSKSGAKAKDSKSKNSKAKGSKPKGTQVKK